MRFSTDLRFGSIETAVHEDTSSLVLGALEGWGGTGFLFGCWADGGGGGARGSSWGVLSGAMLDVAAESDAAPLGARRAALGWSSGPEPARSELPLRAPGTTGDE